MERPKAEEHLFWRERGQQGLVAQSPRRFLASISPRQALQANRALRLRRDREGKWSEALSCTSGSTESSQERDCELAPQSDAARERLPYIMRGVPNRSAPVARQSAAHQPPRYLGVNQPARSSLSPHADLEMILFIALSSSGAHPQPVFSLLTRSWMCDLFLLFVSQKGTTFYQCPQAYKSGTCRNKQQILPKLAGPLRVVAAVPTLLPQIDVEFGRRRKPEMSPSRAIHSGPTRNALSLRQLEVVKLIAEDLTAKQIAASLGITVKTASTASESSAGLASRARPESFAGRFRTA